MIRQVLRENTSGFTLVDFLYSYSRKGRKYLKSLFTCRNTASYWVWPLSWPPPPWRSSPGTSSSPTASSTSPRTPGTSTPPVSTASRRPTEAQNSTVHILILPSPERSHLSGNQRLFGRSLWLLQVPLNLRRLLVMGATAAASKERLRMGLRGLHNAQSWHIVKF